MGNRQACNITETTTTTSSSNGDNFNHHHHHKFQDFVSHPLERLDHLFHIGTYKLKRDSLQHEWSYEGECGPQTWPKYFSGAKGKHQSPINIETRTAVFEPKLPRNPLRINYEADCCSQIKNTGHSFQVDGIPSNKSYVTGGPLENHKYNFLQFHMHWGDTVQKGSEHLIDGHSYSAELHFVNWNSELYKDPKVASQSNQNDGLLVLGVLVELGGFHEEFENVSKCLHDIHLKDEHVPVDHIDLLKLLPKNLSDYWTYKGSLTTPPCSESVTWIVFKDPIKISADQLEKCHLLYGASKEEDCNTNTLIKYNDRPVCQMGDRILYKSFK